MKKITIQNIFLFFIVLSESLFAGSAQLRLDQQEGELGEVFNLRVSISGSLSGKIELPPIQDLQVAETGSSTSVSIINGSFSKETSYNFVLEPQKEGSYTIPSLKLKIDGEWVNTEPVTLTVHNTGGGNPPPPSARGRSQPRSQQTNPDENAQDERSPNFFIERDFSKTSAYEGEPIVVTTKIYHRVQLVNIEANNEKPAGVRILNIKEYDTQEKRGNTLYNVKVIKQTYVPLRSGKIKIPGFRISANVMVQVQRSQRQRNNPFDDFFDDFFNGARSQLVRRVASSKDAELNIQALPSQGRPAKFRDVVGTFSIKSELSHGELKAGDTATLSVTVEGMGTLDSMGSLDLSLSPDIRVYPDKPQVEEKASEKYGLESKRTFRFALVPMHKGDYNLGILKVPYYDLSTSSYQELSTDLGLLKVSEGDASHAVAAAPSSKEATTRKQSDVKSLGNDLIDIHRNVSLSEHGNLTLRDYLFAFFLVGFPGFLCLLVWIFRWFRKFMNSKQGSRRKTAWKNFEKRMSQMNKTSQASSLLETSYSAYREYVGDKLNLQGRALTIKELSAELSKLKAPKNLITELENFEKAIEQSQYAGPSIAPQQAEGLIEKMKMLAREIEKQC
jgi:hypothetical protein